MTNSNLIYIGIAGLGIAMIFTVAIGNNLIPEAAVVIGNNLIPEAAAGLSFPITACEDAGGTYDHWDKIIFISDGAALRDSGGLLIKPRTVLEFKFPQVDPFQPVNVAQLTRDHLSSLGWTNGASNPINVNRIVIIDVDYTAVCVIPPPAPT